MTRTIATFAALHLATAGVAGAQEVRITNLYDAFGPDRDGVTQDFGFAALIEYGGHTILFDSGANAEIFKRNLNALGVDPARVEIAIASHFHSDHTSGFDYLLQVNPKVKMYLPHDFALGAPMEFDFDGVEPQVKEQLAKEQRYFGGEYDKKAVFSSGRYLGARVEYVKSVTQVVEGVTIVPTGAELMGTFVRYPPHDKEPLMVPMPELSVSLRTPQGEVLLVGCSHSSVEVIVKAARETIKRDIKLVAGGYHLAPYDRPYITALAGRLKDEHKVAQVAPAHCTGHLAFQVLRQVYGERYRFFGLGTTLKP
jgi:7,8-dihydropterin-6-yl-methyl-4-(beta-D-ribofuranosyl)aminobenzene 5'-phosphate synthase